MALNEEEVFSGEPLDQKDRFLFYTCEDASGNYHVFDARKLMMYIISTGNFCNPYTRKEFSSQELEILLFTWLSRQNSNAEAPITFSLKKSSYVVDISFKWKEMKPQIMRERAEEKDLECLTEHLENVVDDAIDRFIGFVHPQLQFLECRSALFQFFTEMTNLQHLNVAAYEKKMNKFMHQIEESMSLCNFETRLILLSMMSPVFVNGEF